jgi:hypothetical protein
MFEVLVQSQGLATRELTFGQGGAKSAKLEISILECTGVHVLKACEVCKVQVFQNLIQCVQCGMKSHCSCNNIVENWSARTVCTTANTGQRIATSWIFRRS